MLARPQDLRRAVRALQRRLLARRLAALDLRTRAAALALVGTLAAGSFWQVRVPLDGALRHGGAMAAGGWLAAVLAGFALAGGALAAWRRAALAAAPQGPEWLALPLPPALVGALGLAEARLPAALVVPAAAGAVAAAVGLLPAPLVAASAAAFAAAWWGATRAGAAIAWRRAAPRSPRAQPAATRALLAGARADTARTREPAAWRSMGRARAIAALDAHLSGRQPRLRAALIGAGLFALVALAAWAAPIEPAARGAVAFAAALISGSQLGAWALTRTCGDPASALRVLPLAWTDLWRARAGAIGAAMAAVGLAGALLAPAHAPGARAALALALALPGFAVALLALHLALVLTPRARAAESLFYGWLLVALASSWVLPLSGWAVLAAALVHASRRLPRWARPEVPAC